MREERIPPSFKKKTNRKKLYTKRQLEQKISAKEAEVVKWSKYLDRKDYSCNLHTMTEEIIKDLNKQIEKLNLLMTKL